MISRPQAETEPRASDDPYVAFGQTFHTIRYLPPKFCPPRSVFADERDCFCSETDIQKVCICRGTQDFPKLSRLHLLAPNEAQARRPCRRQAAATMPSASKNVEGDWQPAQVAI